MISLAALTRTQLNLWTGIMSWNPVREQEFKHLLVKKQNGCKNMLFEFHVCMCVLWDHYLPTARDVSTTEWNMSISIWMSQWKTQVCVEVHSWLLQLTTGTFFLSCWTSCFVNKPTSHHVHTLKHKCVLSVLFCVCVCVSISLSHTTLSFLFCI